MGQLNRTEAAELLGVTKAAVDKALRVGRIHYADPAARTFDRAALLASWQHNRKRQRTPRRPPLPLVDGGVLHPRDRLLHAQALAAERDNAVRAGELATVADVRAAAAAAGRAIVTHLEQLPDRLAPRMLGITDARQAAAIVRAEVAAIRAVVAAEIDRGGGARAT
jgi:phage terminase Nu1 subunit (DNA packaging protein)